MKIAYCANRAIYHLLPTTLNSLIQNNPNVEKIYLLIEDDDIPHISHPAVEFINCNNYDCLIRSGVNVTRRFTYMALTRCVLSEILLEDKILYLDIDTTVDGDIHELWDFCCGSNLIAAKEENDSEYYNSGVMLMNLQAIRACKYVDSLARLLTRAKLLLPDQDAINLIFKNRIAKLPDRFNAIGLASEWYGKKEITIRHYAGIVKPWQLGAAPKDVEFWNKYKIDKLI